MTSFSAEFGINCDWKSFCVMLIRQQLKRITAMVKQNKTGRLCSKFKIKQDRFASKAVLTLLDVQIVSQN